MNMLVSGDSTLGMGATEIGAAIRFTLKDMPYDGDLAHSIIERPWEFEEHQTDLTDESAGHFIEYEGTSVLEEYIRLLDATNPA